MKKFIATLLLVSSFSVLSAPSADQLIDKQGSIDKCVAIATAAANSSVGESMGISAASEEVLSNIDGMMAEVDESELSPEDLAFKKMVDGVTAYCTVKTNLAIGLLVQEYSRQ